MTKKKVEEGFWSDTKSAYTDWADNRAGGSPDQRKVAAQQKRAYQLGYTDFRQKLISGIQSAMQGGMLRASQFYPQQQQQQQQPSVSENISFDFRTLNNLVESRIINETLDTISEYVIDFVDQQTKGFVKRSHHMPEIKAIADDIEKNYNVRYNKAREEDIKKLWNFIWAWNMKGRKKKQQNFGGNVREMERIRWFRAETEFLRELLQVQDSSPEHAAKISNMINDLQTFLNQERERLRPLKNKKNKDDYFGDEDSF